MKKSRADTAETRKRIIAAATGVFLARGLAGTGIADIMAAAGMTQGGFYRHFDSKEQLIAEANGAASDRLLAMFRAETDGQSPRQALATVFDLYLDPSEEVSALCSLACLGSELRHADGAARAVAMRGHERMLGFVLEQTRGLDLPDPAATADAIVSTMVGAVTIARLAADPAMAKAILGNARQVVGDLVREDTGVF